jgi:hypothetical protein
VTVDSSHGKFLDVSHVPCMVSSACPAKVKNSTASSFRALGKGFIWVIQLCHQRACGGWLCRWMFQGLANNEMHGVQYYPEGCPAVSSPGKPCCNTVWASSEPCHVVACRWTFQGLVRNELTGIVYDPPGCITQSIPGATQNEIQSVPAHL